DLAALAAPRELSKLVHRILTVLTHAHTHISYICYITISETEGLTAALYLVKSEQDNLGGAQRIDGMYSHLVLRIVHRSAQILRDTLAEAVVVCDVHVPLINRRREFGPVFLCMSTVHH